MDNNELKESFKKEEGSGIWKYLRKRLSFGSSEYPADSYYKKFFFRHASFLSNLLFVLGLLSAGLIFMTTGDPFKAAAVIFLLVWLVVFLRYFLWAVYHYNVNYGLSIKDWENIEDAKKRLKAGEVVLKKELEQPKYNPYRSQTFGVPPGTVRGMLAFTLLFGAVAILIASMGMDQGDLENTLIRDQFEFFKTAFLMMMAFYFGDKSLRFLQKRWKDPNTPPPPANQPDSSGSEPISVSENQFNGRTTNGNSNTRATNLTGILRSDDDAFLEDEVAFAAEEGLGEETTNMTSLKNSLNAFAMASPADMMVQTADLGETEDIAEDGQGSRDYPCTPIIDAGHGGVINGEYTTGNKKRYKFTGSDQNNLEILEGVINRKIALKLIQKLKENGLPYYDLNSGEQEDVALSKRVTEANKLYSNDKSCYYLSIHSNATSSSLQGRGTTANGFEIWTSRNETPSDQLAKIAKKEYQKSFDGKFRFRGLKERNHDQRDLYVLKHTACPALLVENLFFDNYVEAKYLSSDEGQDAIADCLLEVVKSIHFYYED